MTATANGSATVSREDIEAKFRELQGEVDEVTDDVRSYGATVVACLLTRSILPAMFIGLPRLYGAWHHLITGLTQHSGLAEDVTDHRLNTRTVYMNPISRFIYLNMNYHIEHHMFPMVPYYSLPALHAEIKDDLPPPSPSIAAAFREFVPVMLRQRTDPGFYLDRRATGAVPAAAA